MADSLMQVGAVVKCPPAHPGGGQMTIISTNTRVKAGGQALATMGDQFVMAGCAFSLDTVTPHPCVKIQWLTPATRVRIGGKPAILASSKGLCFASDYLPQGAPVVTTTQTRVKGI